MIPIMNNDGDFFMGFNFRKSFKIAPGVKLNVTKKGISSVSVGKNGARVNVSRKGTKTTVGIPGSGLSHSSYRPHNSNESQDNKNQIGFGTLLIIGLVVLFFIIFIFG